MHGFQMSPKSPLIGAFYIEEVGFACEVNAARNARRETFMVMQKQTFYQIDSRRITNTQCGHIEITIAFVLMAHRGWNRNLSPPLSSRISLRKITSVAVF